MRIATQFVTVVVLVALAIPLAGRFVPGARPWLDKAGLLQPLTAVGVVPAAASAKADGARPGGAGQVGGGPAQAGGVPVVASEAKPQVMSNIISAIGSARGVQSVDLSFEVTGRITALKVAPGDYVKAGDMIAELDPETAQLLVDRAKLVAEDADKTMRRLDQLSQSGTTTSLQIQDAELAMRTAELGLQTAQRDLTDHRLIAPISGYVGLIEPQIGDLVSSSTIITRIEDRSSLIVDFRIPERVAAIVAVGDTVQATAVSTPGEVIEGRIIALDNRVDEASRTLRVQATISNADDRLRAGMAFQINLVFTGASYPAVDPLAIQWGAEGAFVWIVRTGQANRLPIRILQRNADAVLIEAALQPGDLVVIEGVQALRPGAEVALAAPRS